MQTMRVKTNPDASTISLNAYVLKSPTKIKYFQFPKSEHYIPQIFLLEICQLTFNNV